jgi:hypothetical protein
METKRLEIDGSGGAKEIRPVDDKGKAIAIVAGDILFALFMRSRIGGARL